MATALENAILWRDRVIAELAAIAADSTVAGGKPNQTGAGTGVDHVGYKAGKLQELREANDLIDRLRIDESAGGDGAWEVTSEAVP